MNKLILLSIATAVTMACTPSPSIKGCYISMDFGKKKVQDSEYLPNIDDLIAPEDTEDINGTIAQ